MNRPQTWPFPLQSPPAETLVWDRGRWRLYRRARWSAPKIGVVLQYREASCPDSGHLYVWADGTFAIDHVDRANPDPPCNRPLAHLVADVPGGGVLAALVIGVVFVGVAAMSAS